jgi:hypothetical protein
VHRLAENICQGLQQDCTGRAVIKCGNLVAPPKDAALIPPDPQTVNRLSAAVTELAQELRRQNERGHGNHASAPGKWTMAAEISFATGNAVPRQAECMQLPANLAKASPNAQRVHISGAAEERGTPPDNNTLSLATSPAEYARARRATVFVSE